MPTLFDYITWRGDIPLHQVPLSSVDSLILSTLVYVHLDGLLSPDLSAPVTIGEAARAYLALPREQRGECRCKTDLDLLRVLADAPRFASLPLCFYDNRLVPEEEMQFAAMAVLLPDGSAYLSYRGTDSTLVGWKEDFNMSFRDRVPSQLAALEYLQRFADAFPGPLLLGGHSKGGNLAVYAGALCTPDVQARIRAVYNNDGPGFTAHMLEAPGYKALLTRIQTFIPQSSVIGMLLEHEEPYTVIKSSQIGILQHDPYSWSVLGGNFILLEEVTQSSRRLDRTVKRWVSSLTPQERGNFVDAVFDLLSAGDVTAIADVLQPANLYATFRALLSVKEEDRRLILDALGHLIKAAIEIGSTPDALDPPKEG